MEISVAIPYHGDRGKWTRQTLYYCQSVPQIREIVITKEPKSIFRPGIINRKVKIYENEKRLYVFRNKVNAVKKCNSEWVMLIDSDNVIAQFYVKPFIRLPKHDNNTIYCPEVGHPKLIYSDFLGENIDLETAVRNFHRKDFDMLLNTMNYVVHRKTWLNALEDALNDEYEPMSADSTWINYNCMKNGMVMQVVKGMLYLHNIHGGSFYKQNAAKGVMENEKIREMMRADIAEEEEEPAEVIKKVNWSGLR